MTPSSIFFPPFFCNITEYYCAKFPVKSIFLSGFTQGYTVVRQKYPTQIGLKKDSGTDVNFHVNFVKCLRTPFIKDLRRLPLVCPINLLIVWK